MIYKATNNIAVGGRRIPAGSLVFPGEVRETAVLKQVGALVDVAFAEPMPLLLIPGWDAERVEKLRTAGYEDAVAVAEADVDAMAKKLRMKRRIEEVRAWRDEARQYLRNLLEG